MSNGRFCSIVYSSYKWDLSSPVCLKSTPSCLIKHLKGLNSGMTTILIKNAWLWYLVLDKEEILVAQNSRIERMQVFQHSNLFNDRLHGLWRQDRVQQQQHHSLFSQASWGRLEMKPERNKLSFRHIDIPILKVSLNRLIPRQFRSTSTPLYIIDPLKNPIVKHQVFLKLGWQKLQRW